MDENLPKFMRIFIPNRQHRKLKDEAPQEQSDFTQFHLYFKNQAR